MKENNNIQDFDNLFKQQLENASMQPPMGLFEGMSSAIGSTAMVAKTTILSKFIIGIISIASIGSIAYFAIPSKSSPKTENNVNAISENKNPIIITNNTENNSLVIEEDKPVKQKYLYGNNTNSDDTKPSEYIATKPDNEELKVEKIEFNVSNVNEIANEVIANNPTTETTPLTTEDKIVEQNELAFANKIDSSYIFIPNAVTPNGDGLNDEYLIDIKGEERVQIIIFDKQYTRLFETKNKHTAWKCTLANGEIAPDGDYIVKVIYTFKNKEQQTKTIKLKLIK